MLPRILYADGVAACITYCVINDERGLDLELRYDNETVTTATYTDSDGLSIDNPELADKCAQALAQWNAS